MKTFLNQGPTPILFLSRPSQLFLPLDSCLPPSSSCPSLLRLPPLPFFPLPIFPALCPRPPSALPRIPWPVPLAPSSLDPVLATFVSGRCASPPAPSLLLQSLSLLRAPPLRGRAGLAYGLPPHRHVQRPSSASGPSLDGSALPLPLTPPGSLPYRGRLADQWLSAWVRGAWAGADRGGASAGGPEWESRRRRRRGPARSRPRTPTTGADSDTDGDSGPFTSVVEALGGGGPAGARVGAHAHGRAGGPSLALSRSGCSRYAAARGGRRGAGRRRPRAGAPPPPPSRGPARRGGQPSPPPLRRSFSFHCRPRARV